MGVPRATADLWRRLPTQFEPGLAAQELNAIEVEYQFEFPPDLRELLSLTLPVGPGFPNWRTGQQTNVDYAGRQKSTQVAEVISCVLEGIIFDVGASGFWLAGLG